MFRDVFTGLERDCAEELKVIRQQYPSEPALVTEKPLILHWHDAMELLREQGEQVSGDVIVIIIDWNMEYFIIFYHHY